MLSKLKDIKIRFEALSQDIINPDIIADNKEWQKRIKEHNSLQPLVEEYDKYVKYESDIAENEQMLEMETDAEMREMLKEEVQNLKDALKQSEEELKILLLPKDENDTKNVIMEFRGGAGGEESSLFAHSLMRMYKMYCDSHKFSFFNI